MDQKVSGRKQNALLNTGSTLILQAVTAISGLILPRLIISAYGSEVNGLCASIIQFLGYISLLQAGVEGVFRASLYRPLNDNNTEIISGIVNDAKAFYRKIGLIFVPYVVGLCFLYPVIVENSFDKLYVATLVLILSISTFLQYFFSLAYVSLISADQKIRIVNFLDSITIILNIAFTVILIEMGFGIHAVKICSCLVFAVKPLFYTYYVRKHYKIDRNVKLPEYETKQKWNGLVHHIAFFIHTNTDIFLLTIFINTRVVSVYALYYAIINGIERVINAITQGSNASLGNLLVSEEKEKINRVFDSFEFIQSSVATVLFSITAILIIPFMTVYMNGINDANYIQPAFAYIMIFSEFLYVNRCIYSSATQNAGKYKETQNGALIECIINIVISVALISRYNLVGIAIGTACGMGSRLIYEILFLKNNVLNRSPRKAIKSLLVNITIAVVLVLPFNFIIIKTRTITQWLILSIIVSVYCIILASIIYRVFYKNEMQGLLHQAKRVLNGKNRSLKI